jgi:cytochrome c oxidase subunit 3
VGIIILLLAGLGVIAAWWLSRQRLMSKPWLEEGAAGATVFAFLIGQLLAWQQLNAGGYYLASNPASTFFYLLTAVHGLHLLGGLIALGRTALRVRGGVDPDRLRLSLELCAMYWHFLLLVWLVLFALLFIT